LDIRTTYINQIIEILVEEDLGRGDLTLPVVSSKKVYAYWTAKEAGVFCGKEIVKKIFNRVDPLITIKSIATDKDRFLKDQRILEVEGPANSLIAAERISLNMAMHLSGIATYTSKLVEELNGTGIKLADTRKTTPGLRILDKYAFRCGGGINHRMGLDDAAMLKENHLAWSNNIKTSVLELKEVNPWPTQIIIEAETPDQAKEAVSYGADGILLDEMEPSTIKKLIPELKDLAAQRSQTKFSNKLVIEVSGIKPGLIKNYIISGVDIISTSSPITKSNWADFSMRYKH
tara:strand:+ start:24898 stop:25764 length:867 start_codon:yes stop_codon:yes gene_type:complete